MTQAFHVTYQLDGDSRTLEVSTVSGVLTPEQARRHIESLHAGSLASDITVQDIREIPGGNTDPGGQLHPDSSRY